jgi:hypothetical protein
MTLDEKAAVGAVLASLPGSNLQIRRPSWTGQTFWSKGVAATNHAPIAGLQVAWVDWLTITGNTNWRTVINKYVLTTYEAMVSPGVEFRILMNGYPMIGMVMQNGVEAFKNPGNVWPAIHRRAFITVGETDRLVVQARNLSAGQKTVVAMMTGWMYPAVMNMEKSEVSGVTDTGEVGEVSDG